MFASLLALRVWVWRASLLVYTVSLPTCRALGGLPFTVEILLVCIPPPVAVELPHHAIGLPSGLVPMRQTAETVSVQKANIATPSLRSMSEGHLTSDYPMATRSHSAGL